MLDSSLDYVRSIRNLSVWRSIPAHIRTALEQDPLPRQVKMSLATVIYLAAVRQRAFHHVKEDGLMSGPKLIVYGSLEVHSCTVKALQSINIEKLKLAIRTDREQGFVPFSIIGTTGSVNTGAVDNLLELSTIALSENLWLLVDDAFGSLVMLDPAWRHLVSGIERADSLSLDFHKWLRCPYDAGFVLVRDVSCRRSTFSQHPSYLTQTGRGTVVDISPFYNLGPELSCSFRALKVWFPFEAHGVEKLNQKIADNCEQAQYLVSQLKNTMISFRSFVLSY